MLEQYYSINEAAGVSINLLADGSAVMHACSVTVKDNRLAIGKKLTGITTGELPARSIVALNLSGKGVLQKQIEKTEEIGQHNFSRILPNAGLEDFYVQNFISGDFSFVSVIRKTEADKWIGQFTDQGFLPVMLSLGPFPVENILPQLNVYDNEFVFNGCVIERNGQMGWTACRYDASALSPFPLKAESESIDEKLLVPYAAAFQLVLADKLEPVKADVTSLDETFRALVAEKKLKVRAFLILCVFFVLLLVNFILFSWLNSANARLTEQVSRSAQNTDDLHKMADQVQQKEALIKTLGWEGAINKSALVDQLAALLPPEMTWREVAVDPVNSLGTPAQRSIAFFDRRIRVTGDSGKIIPVNEWIARIKTKPWVKNVQLDSYAFNSETDTGQFIVSIDY
jgi:Tfp pilus assembly protein PilN